MPGETFSAVLWDFDGTLVNTEPRWIEAEHAYLARFGHTWDDETAASFTGRPLVDVCDAMAGLIGPAVTPEEVLDEYVGMVERINTDRAVPWMPGVPELLAQIHDAGIPMAIVTGSTRRAAQPILDHLEPGLFGAVITRDEVDAATSKPHPRPYLDAAAILGVDPADCLVIEDSVTGATAGNAAGAVVLAVDGLATPGPAARRVHRPDLAGLTLADLVKLWHLGRQDAAPLGAGGGGVLRAGERITLTDPKGRRHSIVLAEGGVFHTTKGSVFHEDLIGGPQGVVATSVGGLQFLAMRPVLEEFTVSMPREAAIIYPKEAAQILMYADVFPGARVLEAGVGSGGLTIPLLRAIGPDGVLHSYERRPEFAQVARTNVENFHGGVPACWDLRIGDLATDLGPEPIDRAILDMLAPWECVEAVGRVLVPGGVLCCYVATTTQMGRVMDQLRAEGGWTEPVATETTTREWHAEGLAIRPAHGTTGHTGFLVISRRLAPGVEAPVKRRRPAPGAYGPDYHGPRPRGIAGLEQWASPEQPGESAR
ncbi:HAD-IA family hydrolase [Acidipropionibacterium timonense]|uniref:HAD-IA family hydrolase n=1 Tax=Acidipropionibacterium timonense TaxID=2161818 RepID=UPI00102F5893|nr:HAD-IA family hydrolase [Acidipropionibacterium timonense]